MTVEVLLLLGSLIVLAVAGDRFVIAITALSIAIRLRPVIVGALIGGLGTSIPELIVVPLAMGRGQPTLALGTVAGSIVANIALGLGLAALVRPLRVDSTTVRREAPISTAAVVLFAITIVGGVSRFEGSLLAFAAGLSVAASLRNAREAPPGDSLDAEVIAFAEDPRPRPSRHGIRALVALGFMLAASEGVVRTATSIAVRIGWGEGLVGLTVVAVGTSAPLIASGIQAARRGEDDVVVGNVLGGNLFIALGGGALIGLIPHDPPGGIGAFAVIEMVLAALVGWAFMARLGRVTRLEAVALLVLYAAALPSLG